MLKRTWQATAAEATKIRQGSSLLLFCGMISFPIILSLLEKQRANEFGFSKMPGATKIIAQGGLTALLFS
jgi:hypothetical protein